MYETTINADSKPINSIPFSKFHIVFTVAVDAFDIDFDHDAFDNIVDHDSASAQERSQAREANVRSRPIPSMTPQWTLPPVQLPIG